MRGLMAGWWSVRVWCRDTIHTGAILPWYPGAGISHGILTSILTGQCLMFVSLIRIYPSRVRDHRPGLGTSPLLCESYQASPQQEMHQRYFSGSPNSAPSLVISTSDHWYPNQTPQDDVSLIFSQSGDTLGKFFRLTIDRSFSNHIYTSLNTADCNWVPAVSLSAGKPFLQRNWNVVAMLTNKLIIRRRNVWLWLHWVWVCRGRSELH